MERGLERPGDCQINASETRFGPKIAATKAGIDSALVYLSVTPYVGDVCSYECQQPVDDFVVSVLYYRNQLVTFDGRKECKNKK